MSMSGPSDYGNVTTTHGILGSIAWVIFLPLGAIVIRLLHGPRAWMIHAAIQTFGMVLFTINFGEGIWMVMMGQGQFKLSDYHPAIGIVLFSFAWTQPISGYTGHILWRKKQDRPIVSVIHIWLGRALITMGMIQGGLGLLYAGMDASRGENIAYGVVAAVIWLTYVGVVVWSTVQSKRSKRASVGKPLMAVNS